MYLPVPCLSQPAQINHVNLKRKPAPELARFQVHAVNGRHSGLLLLPPFVKQHKGGALGGALAALADVRQRPTTSGYTSTPGAAQEGCKG